MKQNNTLQRAHSTHLSPNEEKTKQKINCTNIFFRARVLCSKYSREYNTKYNTLFIGTCLGKKVFVANLDFLTMRTNNIGNLQKKRR